MQHGKGPFLDPCRKEMYFKRDLKSGPSWNQKWPLLAGPFFCPFTCADVLKASRPMCAKVSFRVQPESAATNFGTGEARSHVSNFSCFFRSRK